MRIDDQNANASPNDDPSRVAFKRYALGRTRHFWQRQIATLAGSAALTVFVSPKIGMVAFVIAIVGELIDLATLKTLVNRSRDFSDQTRDGLATLSAFLQALSLSLCTAIAWFTLPTPDNAYVCFAFLTFAAMNAGLSLPHHKKSARARLLVYGSMAVASLIDLLLSSTLATATLFLSCLVLMLLTYLVHTFIKHILHSHEDALRRKSELVAANERLNETVSFLKAQQSEVRQLALVAKHANDIVFITDPERKIVWVNDAFEKKTGYSKSEAIGRFPHQLLNGPDTDEVATQTLHQKLLEGHSHRIEILTYAKDGHPFWVETNQVPVASSTGEVTNIIAVERDITEIKIHQVEMAAAKKQAEATSRSHRDFVARINHEIRTPLNGIIGLADLLLEQTKDDDQRQIVETLNTASEALLATVQSSLDIPENNESAFSISHTEFDLRACIKNAVGKMAARASSQSIFLDQIDQSPLPNSVLGDGMRLNQILTCLISSALQKTRKGGVTVKTDVSGTLPDAALEIEISDTGDGQHASALETAFLDLGPINSQFSVDARKENPGLAVSHLLVRKLGGSIQVSSKPGGGSVIKLSVPVTVLGETERGKPENDHLNPRVPITVLVAEDDKTNRFLMSKYLNEPALKVRFARDGEEAVNEATTHPPDVIFMDIKMPRLDGLGAARKIRRRHGPDVKIFALTANISEADQDACFAAGMDGFIAKPVRKRQLLSKLSELQIAEHRKPL